MRQDRDEDLHVGLAAPGAKGQRLAGEVRHPVQPGLVVEVHLRRAAATDTEGRVNLTIGLTKGPSNGRDLTHPACRCLGGNRCVDSC